MHTFRDRVRDLHVSGNNRDIHIILYIFSITYCCFSTINYVCFYYFLFRIYSWLFFFLSFNILVSIFAILVSNVCWYKALHVNFFLFSHKITSLYSSLLYSTVLFSSLLFSTSLYFTRLYFTVLCSTSLYSISLSIIPLSLSQSF